MGRIPLDADIFLEAEHAPSLRTDSKSIHSELTCAVLVPAINVCIIEDMAIVRAGLRMLIEGEEELRVVGEASNRQQALAAAKAQTPDIFLLDLDLAREDALDLLAELKSVFTEARVVVLTQSSNCDLHELAVEAGARGVVLKEQAPEILVKAIKQVDSGDLFLGRTLANTLITKLSLTNANLKKRDPDAANIASLTPREIEIVQLVAKGLNGRRLARKLHISEATVRNHVTSILDKLGLSSKLELAVYAIQHSLADRPSEPD